MSGSDAQYRVQLEAYAGPLDLLLHLVKRHEIDLHDIPIAELTDQYMAHLRAIETLDMERAGEFLVMAATLLEIKSKTIQPREEPTDEADGEAGETEGGEEPLDPRYELVQQLLAYKQYKDAANHLEAREQDWSARFKAKATEKQAASNEGEAADTANAPQLDLELEDVNVMDLCEAFGRILNSIGQTTDHQVTYDDTPIQLHAEDVADRLNREGPLTLHQLLEGRSNRSEMIGLFLATLELVRDKRARVWQADGGGSVTLELISAREREQLVADEDAPADWRDPETGELQYDWPDEEGRRRAEQRKKRRNREQLKQMRGEGGPEGSDEAEAATDDGETGVFDPGLIRDRSDDTDPQGPGHG